MQPIVGHSVVSLFAGIGGFDLGFQRAGFRIAAHVEKDDNCLKLLSAKWPDAVALDDVCTAGAHNLPPCDVVTFGFPCQDLSVAGKRAGLAGGRSGLFYEATRIINEIKPSYCLFENVPGLLSSDGGRDFARVLMEMDRIGYHGAWRVLDAQWFGVAQRRRRVFGLFSRLDSGAECCAEILSLQESLRGYPAPSREAGEGVAGCLESRTDGGGFPGTDGACAGHVVPAVAGCLQERDAKGADSDTKPGRLIAVNSGQGYWREDDKAGTLGTEARAVMGHDKSHANGGGQVAVAFKPSHFTRGKDGAPADVVAPLSAAAAYGDQESVVAFQPRYFTRNNKTGGAESCGPVTAALSASHAGGDSAPCVAQVQCASGGGKVHNSTAQTLRSGAEHNYQFAQVGMQVRRLTPTECERLQGFPDGWTKGFSDSCRYRMLGNAVCVNVAAWIAGMMANNMLTVSGGREKTDGQ